MNRIFICIVVAGISFACTNSEKKEGTTDVAYEISQTIFFGGDIITMAGDSLEYVEAVVEKDGNIVFVGATDEAFSLFGGIAKKHDLKGNTLMPGFIEPHAHPVSIGALTLANDIVAPHQWRMPHKTYPAVTGKENYLQAVKDIVDSKSDKNKTVFIWGYHKSWHGILTLKDLDRVTGKVPTIIWQRSGHEIYLNSAAMKKHDVKIEDIEEQEQADWTNNHFWERGYQEVKSKKLAAVFGNKEMLKLGMDRLTQMMLQNGITAMGEPSFPTTHFTDEYDILKEGAEKAKSFSFYLIPGFPEQFVLGMTPSDYEQRIKAMSQYDTPYITFLTNQYKSFADGAIYSLALQLKDGFDNCQECQAEWIVPLKEGEGLFNYYWDRGYKLHVHMNGDLAVEKYLDITERALQRQPRQNHRTTFHHLGVFTAEQAAKMAALGIEASVNPYYLWALADKYGETGLGQERAAAMVSIKELTQRNVPVSFHSDFAMAPAEPLTLAWVAINRITAGGNVMRADEKISVYNGMKAITIAAARTLNQEDKIGSIEKGKEATFTILQQNPFKIDPAKIKDISVYGIVYKGRLKQNINAKIRN
jgi:predicted amidohydrolase YtcJ